jgi:hypothetical protein
LALKEEGREEKEEAEWSQREEEGVMKVHDIQVCDVYTKDTYGYE